MTTRTANGLPPLEAVLWRLDEAPFSAIVRFLVGLGVLPMRDALFGRDASGAALLLVFLAVLALMRVAPVGCRRMVPFSDSVRNAWARRRLMAKRYDSYQWQKLFWMGLGLVAGMMWSNNVGLAPGILAATSLGTGGMGIVAWHRRKGLIAKTPCAGPRT